MGQQAEEKRQRTEAKQQPAQPQSTGTSWGWLGSALNSIKTALTTSDKGRDPDSAQGCPFTRRRLVNHAAMEVTDVGSMSASEILLRRRRLASGVHVSPVLTVLMDEIEDQAQPLVKSIAL